MKKKDLFRLYISVALALIGIFTIISPQYAMFAVVIILGVILTLWGLVSIIRWRNSAPQSSRLFENNQKKNDRPFVKILLSILLLIAGILLLIFSFQAKNEFIPVVIGFWSLIAGVFATINAVSLYRQHKEYLLSVIALVVSFTTAIALFTLSAGGFTSPAGGVFLLIFGLVTSIEISVSGRNTASY